MTVAPGSPQFSADGKWMCYVSRKRGEVRVVVRDMSSGAERELIRRNWLGSIHLSPDGRFIATSHRPEKSDSDAVLLIPVDGGEARELMRVKKPQFIQTVPGWGPNSREVMVSVGTELDENKEKDILLVSTENGSSRPLEAPDFRWGSIHIHPDGRQIAYLAGKNAAEVWVLENFLPK